jgi:hypothetical protein
MGADSMRSKIAAWLMMNGYMTVAPRILQLELPQFSLPETVMLNAATAVTPRKNLDICTCDEMARQAFFEWRCPVHGYQSSE